MAPPEQDKAARNFGAPATRSRLYVYRDQFLGGGLPIDLTVNSRLLATLVGYTFLVLDLDPGQYKVQSESSTLELDLLPGKTTYVWQEMLWGPKVLLHEVDEKKGQDGIASAKLVQIDTLSLGKVRPLGTNSRPGMALTKSHGDRELVAVLNIAASSGVSTEQSSAIADRIREQLINTGYFRVVERDQLDAILSEQALQQTGCTSTECAVKVGKILGARKMLAGRMIRLGDQVWQLSESLIDVETSETTRAETVIHEGSFLSLLTDGPNKIVNKLISP